MRDKACRGREGRRALGGFLPFTASDVLPKGSARGRISGSRSAVSGDLSPSISFSGLSRKRRKAGDREKQKKKNTRKDNVNEVLRSVASRSVGQPVHNCVYSNTLTWRGQSSYSPAGHGHPRQPRTSSPLCTVKLPTVLPLLPKAQRHNMSY